MNRSVCSSGPLKKVFACLFLICWAIALPCPGGLSASFAGQWLLGDLGLTDANGKRLYGAHLSVFVTKGPVPVPSATGLNKLEHFQRLDRINQMHLDFFKRFTQARSRPGFLVAHTEASETGNFAFLSVAPGDYYIVVLFPAMIKGHKVAWQQPVHVRVGHTAYVSLDEMGLVIPLGRP